MGWDELSRKKRTRKLGFQKGDQDRILACPREYPKEYKLESLRLYIANGKQRNKTTKELGVPLTTLRGWIKKHMSEVTGKPKDKSVKRAYERELEEKDKKINDYLWEPRVTSLKMFVQF